MINQAKLAKKLKKNKRLMQMFQTVNKDKDPFQKVVNLKLRKRGKKTEEDPIFHKIFLQYVIHQIIKLIFISSTSGIIMLMIKAMKHNKPCLKD